MVAIIWGATGREAKGFYKLESAGQMLEKQGVGRPSWAPARLCVAPGRHPSPCRRPLSGRCCMCHLPEGPAPRGPGR